MNIRKQKKKAKKFLKNEGFKGLQELKLKFTNWFSTLRFVAEIDSTARYVFEKNKVQYLYHEFTCYYGEHSEEWGESFEEWTKPYKKRY